MQPAKRNQLQVPYVASWRGTHEPIVGLWFVGGLKRCSWTWPSFFLFKANVCHQHKEFGCEHPVKHFAAFAASANKDLFLSVLCLFLIFTLAENWMPPTFCVLFLSQQKRANLSNIYGCPVWTQQRFGSRCGPSLQTCLRRSALAVEFLEHLFWGLNGEGI